MAETREDQMFQSLFSWNLLLMPSGRAWSLRLCGVSILVFVELALDEFGLKKTSQKDKFQSLFSWNLLLMSLD